MYDVIIVGGGPAGLNAALILGRCRRKVLLCDAGQPRNGVSRAVNGFMTRDGTPPIELRAIAREELKAYPCVEVRDVEAIDADRLEAGFEVVLADGRRERGRRLLLATGLSEDLPPIEGVQELWGCGVYNCPYCDGWEHRDQPLAVYGQGCEGYGLALELRQWTADLVLCTDGPSDLPAEDRARLHQNGIEICEKRVARLEGAREGGLERVWFDDGSSIERQGLFFIYGDRQGSQLATKLGCQLTDKGTVQTKSYEKTNVPGLYVAGDASRRVHFAIVAAAEGAMAAFAINTELLKEDLE